MTSVTLADLKLSIRAPAEGWTGDVIDEHRFRLYGPEQPSLDGYSPTMSFRLGEPEGFGDEWFDRFMFAVVREMELGYTDFKLIREERFELSSVAPVHAVWYEWIDGGSGLHFVQLQAYILVSRFSLYVVNAATLKPIEAEFVPIFDSILRSVRILRP